MAYPGDGYTMSNYGKKKYSPEQLKEQWREYVVREKKKNQHHPNATKAKSAADTTDADINYFNTQKTHPQPSSYNQTFHFDSGYNAKLKREDMKYSQGLDVYSEEVGKAVPVLSSSEYGRRPALDKLDREHVRVGVVKRDFFRSRGIINNPGA